MTVYPTPEWATEVVALLREAKEAAFAGTVRVSEPQPLADRVTQLLSDPMDADDGTLVRAQSANLVVPADGFEAVGGFDESYSGAGYEDYDFCRRWRKSGRRILAAPRAIVLHQREHDSAWVSADSTIATGAVRPISTVRGQKVPATRLKASLQRMLQTHRLRAYGCRAQLGYTGLVGLSQIAALAGFATARISKS